MPYGPPATQKSRLNGGCARTAAEWQIRTMTSDAGPIAVVAALVRLL
jgi:hypothetical protein